jgi:hypothetical protein
VPAGNGDHSGKMPAGSDRSAGELFIAAVAGSEESVFSIGRLEFSDTPSVFWLPDRSLTQRQRN